MTQMEEITVNIEKYRIYLQNLIRVKKNLIDFEIVEASQKLDLQLNLYHSVIARRN